MTLGQEMVCADTDGLRFVEMSFFSQKICSFTFALHELQGMGQDVAVTFATTQ